MAKKATRKAAPASGKAGGQGGRGKKKPAAKAPPPGDLLEVIPGRVLNWPWPPHSPRGGHGDVVRADDPLLDTGSIPTSVLEELPMAVEKGWDQKHKLRPAPKGATLSPMDNRQAAGVYEAMGYEGYGYTPRREEAPEPKKRPTEKVPEPPARTSGRAEGEGDLEVPPIDGEDFPEGGYEGGGESGEGAAGKAPRRGEDPEGVAASVLGGDGGS